MKSTDDIYKLIKKLHVEPSADTDRNVHNRIKKSLEQWEKTKPVFTEPATWRKIMKLKITKFAAAAVIMFGVILGVHYWGGGMDGTTVAWAHVAERVQKSKAFIYHMSVITDGTMTVGNQILDMPDMEMNWIFSEEYGAKMEMFTAAKEKTIEQWAYMIPANNLVIVVMPEQKKYMKLSFEDEVAKNIQEQWEKNGPRNMFKQVMDCDYVELGRTVIDGIEVEGLETTDPKYAGGMFEEIAVRIWVEVETNWPVRMEMDAVMESPVGEGTAKMHIVIDGFQWDVQVDPEEFVPNIPEDYSELTNIQMPRTDVTGAVDGFRVYVELTGHYPEELNVMSLMKGLTNVITTLENEISPREIENEVLETHKDLPAEEVLEILRQKLQEEYSGKLPETLLKFGIEKSLARAKRKLGMVQHDSETEPDQMQLMMQITMPIQSLGMFYMQLVQQDKNPRYYGDRVEPGDTEQILMIWKGDKGRYEVIYGDLSTTVLTPDQVPQLDDISNSN